MKAGNLVPGPCQLKIVDGSSARLHPYDPAGRTQQLVLSLAPLAQLGRAHGVTAQVQEHFGPLVEALAGEGAGSVRNARTVGKELPAGRLARAVSEQLDLQNMWVEWV